MRLFFKRFLYFSYNSQIFTASFLRFSSLADLLVES
jgi:hypothetical protein